MLIAGAKEGLQRNLQRLHQLELWGPKSKLGLEKVRWLAKFQTLHTVRITRRSLARANRAVVRFQSFGNHGMEVIPSKSFCCVTGSWVLNLSYSPAFHLSGLRSPVLRFDCRRGPWSVTLKPLKYFEAFPAGREGDQGCSSLRPNGIKPDLLVFSSYHKICCLRISSVLTSSEQLSSLWSIGQWLMW